jgi:hypothetical protein
MLLPRSPLPRAGGRNPKLLPSSAPAPAFAGITRGVMEDIVRRGEFIVLRGVGELVCCERGVE